MKRLGRVGIIKRHMSTISERRTRAQLSEWHMTTLASLMFSPGLDDSTSLHLRRLAHDTSLDWRKSQ